MQAFHDLYVLNIEAGMVSNRPGLSLFRGAYGELSEEQLDQRFYVTQVCKSSVWSIAGAAGCQQ